MGVTVMKFGGTSLATAGRIRDAAELVRRYAALRPVVVVSAMGKASESVGKVTDALFGIARQARTGPRGRDAALSALAELEARHLSTLTELVERGPLAEGVQAAIAQRFSELRDFCIGVSLLGELSPRSLDAIAGYGEKLCSLLMAATLTTLGTPAEAVSAEELIVTDDRFQNASPDMTATTARSLARLGPLLEGAILPVVTGYIGATPEGVTTTLGRNASDFSATIMGAALHADEVWIWTDADGVMSADPRIVPTARTLPEISYVEASELAYFGSNVLHPRTIVPAVQLNIPLRIKNTLNPEHPGTLISAESPTSKHTAKAVTKINGLSLVTLHGLGMLGVPGLAGRAFSAVAAEGINILMISQSSSESNICFAIDQADVERTLRALKATFALEMLHHDIDVISAHHDVAIVAAVGRGMKGTPGVAGRVFAAVGRAGVNCLAIAQGSSELNISFVVEGSQAADAMRAVHEAVVEEGA